MDCYDGCARIGIDSLFDRVRVIHVRYVQLTNLFCRLLIRTFLLVNLAIVRLLVDYTKLRTVLAIHFNSLIFITVN